MGKIVEGTATVRLNRGFFRSRAAVAETREDLHRSREILCHNAFDHFKESLASSPYDYLEIGSWNGAAICQLASLYPNKRFYSIDPFIEDGHTVAASRVEKGQILEKQRECFLESSKNLNNLVHFNITSGTFLLSGIALKNVGHVLIDGSHWYDDVMVDFSIALAALAGKEGEIYLDDTNVADVERAMNDFERTFLYNIQKIIQLSNAKLYKLRA